MQTPSGVHLWLILMKAFHAIGAYGFNDLRSSGLGLSDFGVLEVLLHKGAMPVNAIGPKVFLTPGSISVAVDRLHRSGLVTRVNSRTDRRVRVVDLTPQGRSLIEKVFQTHADSLEELVQVLTAAERAEMANLLRKLGRHAAEQQVEQDKPSKLVPRLDEDKPHNPSQ